MGLPGVRTLPADKEGVRTAPLESYTLLASKLGFGATITCMDDDCEMMMMMMMTTTMMMMMMTTTTIMTIIAVIMTMTMTKTTTSL